MATFALFTRQSLLVAYIVAGALMGPSGLKLISDPAVISEIGHFGIIFLLFLLGLNLQPQNLLKMLKQTTLVTLLSSVIFGALGFPIGILSGLTVPESLVVGACMMYSSTIIGLKLLPTTVLHHQRIGEIIISILLLQDIIAIFTLLLLHGASTGSGLSLYELLWVMIALPGLGALAFLIERIALMWVIKRFNRIHEYVFLIAIGWCLGLGQLAEYLKLSFEIGAFIAGITLASSPISRFIAESLRPLRDFFLILFFFSLGASLYLPLFFQVLLAAVLLAMVMLFVKPWVFRWLLRKISGTKSSALEIGVRLGQISEFSLLVAYMALENQLISEKASYLIQAATILTFIVSSYWIVNRYPSPIATKEALRRD